MRGLSLQQTYPLSPFTPVNERVQEGDEFDCIFEMYPTDVKHVYMVDAGLTFNSPYPLVLRPQRDVDVILSFDFSARPSDTTPPFKVGERDILHGLPPCLPFCPPSLAVYLPVLSAGLQI